MLTSSADPHLAKAIDQLLRSRTTSAVSVSTKLDDLLTLVRFTRDKDVFKAFYVTGLAKRLLLGRTASDDAELGMVDRLKKGEPFVPVLFFLSDRAADNPASFCSPYLRAWRRFHNRRRVRG